jgi:transcriptional regulator with XRE-family HTH domain
MQIGEKIKLAIENSKFSAPEVAADADMSKENLYKIYKSDSVQTRYLIPIAKKLGIPVSYFLDDNATILPAGVSMHVAGNSAGGNMDQKIMDGGIYNEGNAGGTTNIIELEAKLKICEAEKHSLKEILKMKEKFIEILEKHQTK